MATYIAAGLAVGLNRPARHGSRIHAPDGVYGEFAKRFLDIGLVLLVLPVVLPLVLALAIVVARDGGRPFFAQYRLGRGGLPFRMWKLRTMVADADARLADHLRADPQAMAEWDARQKLARDPRVTMAGRWLRKSSLDELPQVWNVLRGDMSLVGPRPMLPDQRRLYPGTDYFALRPGITGPWQVSCRNSGVFAERARYDADYRRRLSLGTDLRLLMATVGVVLRGTGR